VGSSPAGSTDFCIYLLFNLMIMDISAFIMNNLAELLIGVMALIKLVVNLTPTEKDNQVFGYVDSLLNMIIADRIKPKE